MTHLGFLSPGDKDEVGQPLSFQRLPVLASLAVCPLCAAAQVKSAHGVLCRAAQGLRNGTCWHLRKFRA